MVPQRNNSGRTVALPSGTEDWFKQEFGENYLKDPIHRPNVLWWHKHPGEHPGNFSTQDLSAINSLCSMGGIVMSVVTSSTRKVLARLDYNLPISELPLSIKLDTVGMNSDIEIVEPDYLGFKWNNKPDAPTYRECVDEAWDSMVQDYDDNPGMHETSEKSLFDLADMDDEDDPVKKRIKAAAHKALDKNFKEYKSENLRVAERGNNGESSVRTMAQRVRDAIGFAGWPGHDYDDDDVYYKPPVKVTDLRRGSIDTCKVCNQVLYTHEQRLAGLCWACEKKDLLKSGME